MIAEFEARLSAAVNLSGRASEMARRRFEKEGKQTARQRIQIAIDPGSYFMELSSLAAFGMYGGETHSAGVVTGIGRIGNAYCMIFSNEGAVKGGTWVEPSCRKVLRAQELALALNIFCVYIVDSGGAFLPDQANVYPELFGRIFRNQAEMSSVHNLLQIAVVVGLSTAGGAYVPAMCDYVVITESGSSIFLAGPPLVKSATGEIVTAQELGGGPLHARVSGVADFLAKNENEALGPILKSIVQSTVLSDGSKIIGESNFSSRNVFFNSEGVSLAHAVSSNGKRRCILLETWTRVSDETFGKIAMLIRPEIPLIILEKQWGFLNEGIGKGTAMFLKALAKVKHKLGIVTAGSAAIAISSKGFNPGLFFLWPGVCFETTKGQIDCYKSTAIINDDGIIHPQSTGRIISTCLELFSASPNRSSLYRNYAISYSTCVVTHRPSTNNCQVAQVDSKPTPKSSSESQVPCT